MNYLSVENLSKSYGERVLFENISFGIARGEKVALVAANGAGKSTLLRIIKGKDLPDAGKVVFRNDVTIGFLDQEPAMDPEATVLETLFASQNPLMSAVREYEYCLAHSGEDQSWQKRLNSAIEKMESLKAWDYEARTKQILGKLGIHDFDRKTGQLSGGQKKRVALARLLIEDPEFIILDEPTNHLDVDMIEWLEGYLIGLNKTILLVTHDRYFLDRVTSSIVELEDGKLYTYEGSYSYFLDKKAERQHIQNAEIDKAKNIFRRELEWMRRQPKARTTKSKSRIDSFYDIAEKAGQKKSEEKVNLAVNMNRLGNKILEMDNVSKSFGDKVILKKFSYVFRRRERIGIVGKNGAGKSTFLNLLLGTLYPDKGMIETGETVVFGHYSQEGLQLKEDKRIIDVVKEIAEFIPVGDGKSLSASQFLQHFQFPPSKQYTYVSKLSGGEKRRLHLLTVLMKNPNFLVLDEPTNDLDLLTLGLLEEFLLGFEGCLIVVTHDRYFMDRLVDHLFVFEGEGNIKDFNGTYSEYKEYKSAKAMEERPVKPEEPAPSRVQSQSAAQIPKKLTYKEQREFELLEKEISQLEKEKKEVELKMNSGISDHMELDNLARRFSSLSEEIDRKTERWIELSEKTG
jgi:ABC transport system ATP-binding/permease protein